jgi:signal transduction histidine kinase
VLAAVSDSALKGEALVAIARVQRKAGQLDAARVTCETILDGYGQVNTRAGTPLGPVAHLEHGSLLLEAGDSAAAVNTFVDLYKRLVDGEWILERAQYDFFRGRAQESIDAIASAASLPSAMQSKESERRRRTERLLLLQATAAERLNARLDRGSGTQTAGGNRFTLESGGQTYLVSLLGRSDSEPGVWGLLLDAGYLGDTVLARSIGGQVDSETTDWAVRGRDGITILARADPPEGTVALNATFAGDFPPWLIEFYQRPQNPYKRLLASSQSVYFYMFLLIAAILVFGLVLTVRAVTQELELARLKSDFVSTVSHEFKSPVTSIRQLAEMLQAGRVPDEERRRRYYDVLVEQSSRLSSLVINILDLARIEEGRKEFRFEAIDVGELLRDIATTVQHRVGHEGYVIEADIAKELLPVSGDKDAITQAVTNLIDNAIQYSDDAKQINLSGSLHDELVTIAVEDFGVGIPDDDFDKIFDRFYRGGDALTRSVKGSGLGLTLIQEIVEAHGGTVHVESTLGEGSKFSIRLPASTEQSDAKDPDR